MAVHFHCACGRALIADEAHRGMEVKCPACGSLLKVPSEVPAAALAAPPAAPRACAHCGSPVGASDPACPKCGAFLDAQAAPPTRPGLPWERRDEIGTWPAAFQTLKKVLLSPNEAFREMTLDNPLGGAFLFFIIFGCGGAVIGAVWGALFQAAMWSTMSKFMPPPPSGAPPFNPAMMGAFQGVVGVVVAPFTALISVAILSGLAHLALMVTGAKPKDFAVTMSVFAYGMGSAWVFQVVPLCGGLVAWVWAVVCVVCGLIEVHRCETWKALLAVLWPVLLCCCCVGGAFGIAAMGAGLAKP